MKRGTISSVTKSNVKRSRKKTEEVSHIETQRSFSDLPRDLLLNILLRVSFKRVFVCKCVCKIWCDLISDPEFKKLYADKAEVYPLLRTTLSRNYCEMVYLVDPDKDDFELNLGMCDHTVSEHGCDCNVRDKIETQLEIPLKCGQHKHYMYDINYGLVFTKKTNYGLVHSCNGLLCLSNLYDKSLRPPIVCNPITGEFINLPEVSSSSYNTCYGFGFSPATNQYKVIRMFQQPRVAKMAEVHILGTKTWKEIGFFNEPMPMSKQSTVYLNGFLYWSSNLKPLSIFTFDIENERFGSIPAPAINKTDSSVSLGVLGGELCMSEVIHSEVIHVWTMKDNGTEKAWSKNFSFDNLIVWDCGALQPIKYLNDGALLMYNSMRRALVYLDPKQNRYRFLKIGDFMLHNEVIPYTPTFDSLKCALSGQDVKVLNVRSTKSKLKREDGVDIVEQNTKYI